MAIKASAKDKCRCGHEREWHNSCSRCFCPWFLAAGDTAARAVLHAWRAEAKARELKEG